MENPQQSYPIETCPYTVFISDLLNLHNIPEQCTIPASYSSKIARGTDCIDTKVTEVRAQTSLPRIMEIYERCEEKRSYNEAKIRNEPTFPFHIVMRKCLQGPQGKLIRGFTCRRRFYPLPTKLIRFVNAFTFLFTVL